MSSRGQLHKSGERVRTEGRTSVVGSKVGQGSSGRRLPRGGIREQGSLSLAEGALPDSTVIGSAEVQRAGVSVLRMVAIVSAALIVLLFIVGVTLAILAHTSAFVIDSVEAVDTEHAKAEDIVRLVQLEEGATLLSFDEGNIRDSVLKNPWIGSVEIERVFPGTLRIVATERQPRAVVAMSSGGVAWLLASDGHWIEPVTLEVASGESSEDAALARATDYGAVLITGVPADVAPVAGAAATDESILAALSFSDQFSDSFSQQVVSYAAPSGDDIACLLSNGVEVALGSPSNVDAKERIVQQVLNEYGGRVTYINVRVPSRPTYRYVDSPYVREGSGATGQSATETRNETLQKDTGSSSSDEAGNATGTDSGTDSAAGEGSDAQSTATDGADLGATGTSDVGTDGTEDWDSTGNGYGYTDVYGTQTDVYGTQGITQYDTYGYNELY